MAAIQLNVVSILKISAFYISEVKLNSEYMTETQLTTVYAYVHLHCRRRIRSHYMQHLLHFTALILSAPIYSAHDCSVLDCITINYNAIG